MPGQRESLREGAISAGATSRNSEGNSGAIPGSAIPFYGIVGPFFHSKFFDFTVEILPRRRVFGSVSRVKINLKWARRYRSTVPSGPFFIQNFSILRWKFFRGDVSSGTFHRVKNDLKPPSHGSDSQSGTVNSVSRYRREIPSDPVSRSVPRLCSSDIQA